MQRYRILGVDGVISWVISSISLAIIFPLHFFWLFGGLAALVANFIPFIIFGIAQFLLAKLKVVNQLYKFFSYVIVGIMIFMLFGFNWRTIIFGLCYGILYFCCSYSVQLIKRVNGRKLSKHEEVMQPINNIGMRIVNAWILSSILTSIIFPGIIFYLLFGLLVVAFNLIFSSILGITEIVLLKLKIRNQILFLFAYIFVGLGVALIVQVNWKLAGYGMIHVFSYFVSGYLLKYIKWH